MATDINGTRNILTVMAKLLFTSSAVTSKYCYYIPNLVHPQGLMDIINLIYPTVLNNSSNKWHFQCEAYEN